MATPTLDQLKRALHLGERIEELQKELASIFGRAGAKALDLATSGMKMATRGIEGSHLPRKKPKFSKAARAAIAEGQRKRWAKVKSAKTGSEPAAAKAEKPTKRKKGKMSAAGRAAIVAAQKLRWDKVRAKKAKKA